MNRLTSPRIGGRLQRRANEPSKRAGVETDLCPFRTSGCFQKSRESQKRGFVLLFAWLSSA
jgi:hypothetical protein